MRLKPTYLLAWIFLILAPQLVQAQLYILDFTDPTTFSYDCGKVNPPMWEVSNDSCTLETGIIDLPDTCGTLTDIPLAVTLNQSGNLECDDQAYIWYKCDTTWHFLDTVPGCTTTYVITYYYAVPCPAGKPFQVKVSFLTNHNTEKWQLRNNDIVVGNPCPITLENDFNKLQAFITNSGVKVTWNMYNSLPAGTEFTIERSFDGKAFSEVGSISTSSVIDAGKEFVFIDPEMNVKDCYYRIKLSDQNKTFIYSNILTVTSTDHQNIFSNIYPNPANNTINANVHIDADGDYQIMMMDFTGKIYLKEMQNLPKGSHELKLDVTTLPTGVYYLMISNHLYQEQAKISVLR